MEGFQEVFSWVVHKLLMNSESLEKLIERMKKTLLPIELTSLFDIAIICERYRFEEKNTKRWRKITFNKQLNLS